MLELFVHFIPFLLTQFTYTHNPPLLLTFVLEFDLVMEQRESEPRQNGISSLDHIMLLSSAPGGWLEFFFLDREVIVRIERWDEEEEPRDTRTYRIMSETHS